MQLRQRIHENFIAYNRGFVVVRRHFPMLAKPIFCAVISLLIWYFLRAHGVHLNRESEIPLTSAIIPLIGLIYGIKAGLVLNAVWDEYKTLSFAVVKRDKETFLLHRDEQVPIMIHLLLGTMAFTILGLVMIIEYQDFWTGVVSVFVTAFILSLMAVIVVELDDPKQSIWFKEKIPQEWLEIDVNHYFETKKD